jgi:phosphatidylglycerophosphate synthase
MASIYELKPKFQAVLRPAVRRLVAAGISPNGVTLLALAGSLAVGLLLLQAPDRRWILLLLPAWLFVRMALNAIDGMMAREFHLSTPAGAFLNEIGDVLSDVFLFLPLAAVEPEAWWPIVAFSTGAVLTEFCGVLGRALGASRRYDGPMGKSDRVFLVGLLAAVLYFAPSTGMLWPWTFAAASALTLLTCWNRARRALREIA